MANVTIRVPVSGDEQAIHALLHELAVYERLTEDFLLTPAIIAHDIIGTAAQCGCAIAEVDGDAAGIATWYPIYSTFGASRGLYLEDLFVRPEHRKRGVGTLLIAYLATHARAQGATHIRWSVLEWNRRAISFYERLGASPVGGWYVYHISGQRLEELLTR